MASSSDSHSANYDVYLSFRGEDTRNNFVSHLHAALCWRKIQVFLDHELDRGDEISAYLSKAIEGSKISVIVFSEGYASSRWLLQELVKILECKNKYGQIVIPVFYHVDPSNVREQTGTFGKGFAKLVELFKESPYMLQKWRIALTEAANLSGYLSHVTRPEAHLVEAIVNDIMKRLNYFLAREDTYLVGVESSIEEIKSLLDIGSENVRIVGICGMGGIGKTSIARVVFDSLSSQFEGSYFVENVNGEWEKDGLVYLRSKLLFALLGDVSLNMTLIFTKERLRQKKVLIVFDDVTHLHQINFLIGDLRGLGEGSRVIITTRNKQIVRCFGANDIGIYEVQTLGPNDALQLFCKYAFKQNHPIEAYMDLSNRIVNYANGVPLALKVLGSSMIGKGKPVWESVVRRLEIIPDNEIIKVLKLSYDGLDDLEKSVFLDVACFFKGWDIYLVKEILNATLLDSELIISDLIDKSLIIIMKGTITMHGLLQQMGWEIVRQESKKDPCKRSRLWYHKDVYYVLSQNMGTENIEGICLDLFKSEEIYLDSHAFSKMHNLRFLNVYSSTYGETKNKIHCSQGLEFHFRELRYLCWHGYPLKSLLNFHPKYLVALNMPHSNLVQFRIGVQNLLHLRYVDLSHSEDLIEISDISCAPHLESLTVEGCTSLSEISSSIQYLNELVILNFRGCKRLRSLPVEIPSKSLKKVILSGCSNLKMVPKFSSRVEELYLDGTAIEELPSSIKNLDTLEILNLRGCSRLKHLPNVISELKSLKHLYVSGCSELDRLPDEMGNLKSLEALEANESARIQVSPSIKCLSNLHTLSFETYKGQAPLDLLLPILSSFFFLEQLNLTDCNITELPENLGQLSSLKSLKIARNDFESIPKSIKNLCKLTLLDVSFCYRLQCLPELPWQLEYVKAQSCTSLQTLSNLPFLFTSMKRSQNRALNFINCLKLDLDALGIILTDALQKIEQNFIHWQEAYEMVWHDAKDFLCVPGSEIPNWFDFQTTGCYIELPRDSLNLNLIGLAFCIVIAFGDHQDDSHELIVNFELLLKSEDAYYKKVAGGLIQAWHKDDAPDRFESDHIFLVYDCNTHASGFPDLSYNSQAIIYFYVSKNDRIHLECCKVKKCGVRFLYNRHSGEPVEESSKSCISTEDEDEGEANYSSGDRQVKHDVFLSFKGEDTRNKLTSHLRAALCRAKIETCVAYADDHLIREDKPLSSYLMNAIEESMISVIIFSYGYVSSECCLEELVQILECKKKYGQAVIPIFHSVYPLHEKNQTDSFWNAFAKLEELYKESPETLKKWSTALEEAANLDGINSNDFWWESDLVEETVKRILTILNRLYPSVNKDLVGVQSSIKKIESLLCIGSEDVCIVGIWGMGGIGKTTIAKALYDEIRSQFEGSYFALNVREESENLDRLTLLRQELLSSILKDGPSNSGFIFTKLRLFHKRVLLVFDDVTSLEQMKFLIGDLNCLGFESRIIITTRDRQVLKNCGVDANNIYKVDPLFHHEALQLFSWYAFQQNRPAVGYNELSNRVIKYAKGVPLALTVLGSFLCEKTKSEWESAINNLKESPCKKIQMVLKISYDGLDNYEKNILLDIACFLKWESRDFIIKILNSSGFFAEIGISVLIDRCLITVSNNRITMHDLLQEMCLEIVREECKRDPSNCSRLWNYADIYHVLKNNMGSKTIEGICLDMSKITHLDLNPCAFAEMPNLRFLKLYNSHCEENSINKLRVTKDLEFVFAELSYLCWHGCPLKSLQSGFCLENLVSLDMPYSDIQQLWMGDQILFNLKTINLSHSKHLQGSPNFSFTPNLEILILEGCSSLLEISSSINCLDKLVVLNLRQCNRLHSLPMSINSKFLRIVNLSSCSNLEKFPRISGDIEELFLDETAIEELPLSIENPSGLVTLKFKDCSRLESLPSNICQMKSLEHLDISGCSKLDGSLDSLRSLEALKVLKLEKLAQRELSASIVHLGFLKELNLTDCGLLMLPSNLGKLSMLTILFLGRNNFETIPVSILDLHKLSYLDLNYCQWLRSLPELPSRLQYVDASSCKSLKETSGLSILFPAMSKNVGVSFINCFKLEQSVLEGVIKDILLKIGDTKIELALRPSAYICFPGNQIPECFTFKSIGASISSNQTLGNFNPRLVSFAVCAVVEFQNYHDDGHGLVVRCECKLGNRYGKVLFYYDIGCNYIDSEHIFLGYDLHTCSFNCDDNPYIEDSEVSIQFYVEDSTGKQRDCCKVKKCGFGLLFYQVIRNQDDEEQAVLDELEDKEPPIKKLKGALL